MTFDCTSKLVYGARTSSTMTATIFKKSIIGEKKPSYLHWALQGIGGSEIALGTAGDRAGRWMLHGIGGSEIVGKKTAGQRAGNRTFTGDRAWDRRPVRK
jgi:hypothetical protein